MRSSSDWAAVNAMRVKVNMAIDYILAADARCLARAKAMAEEYKQMTPEEQTARTLQVISEQEKVLRISFEWWQGNSMHLDVQVRKYSVVFNWSEWSHGGSRFYNGSSRDIYNPQQLRDMLNRVSAAKYPKVSWTLWIEDADANKTALTPPVTLEVKGAPKSSQPQAQPARRAYADNKSLTGIDAKGIRDLFARATEAGLKSPKIRLRTQNVPVVISMAKPTSKNSGCLYVAGPEDAYYGKITPQGHYIPTTSATPAIRELVASLSSDPAGVAGAQGQQYGSCCFCGITLTDDRSRKVGYGPICASKWSLSWGEEGYGASCEEATNEGGEHE